MQWCSCWPKSKSQKDFEEKVRSMSYHPNQQRAVLWRSYFVMHKAQIPPRATWVCSSPQQESTTSSQPQIESTIADSHLSPLVKLIHLSHTTVRCNPTHASFIRISTHILRERSDTQGKKNRKQGPETRYPESSFPNALILLCRVLGVVAMSIFYPSNVRNEEESRRLNSHHNVCEEESRECKNRGEDESKEM